MKSLVFVILGKWNYGFNVLFCHQFVRQTHPLTLPCVTAGDGCDGYLDTATAIIKPSRSKIEMYKICFLSNF